LTPGKRTVSGLDFVYVRADGIRVNVRLEQDKLCPLVISAATSPGRLAGRNANPVAVTPATALSQKSRFRRCPAK